MIGVGVLAGGIAFSPIFDVDRVEVRGAAETGPGPVLEALREVGVAPGEAMVRLDLDHAAASAAALPWVESAEVVRDWPATVSIEVVERVAVAAVPARGGGFVVLDASGRQLATARRAPAGLVVVDGETLDVVLGDPTGPDLAGALAMVAAIPTPLALVINRVTLAPSGDLEASLILADGSSAKAVFGPPDAVRAKLVALATLLDQVDPSGLSIVDLRVPASPVLTRR